MSRGHFTHTDRLSGFGTLARSDGEGYFSSRGIGFIGFKFNGAAGPQYGWARVKMRGVGEGNGFRILDYAYADPGEPIRTGQTSSAPGQANAIPDSGSLGLLALGGAGLMAWRKRRAKTTAARQS